MIQGKNGEIAFRATLDTAELERSAKRASAKFGDISHSARKEVGSIQQSLATIGRAVGVAFSIQQAVSFVRQMVSVRSEIQALEVSFRTLLGSQEASTRLMSQMKEFAAATPLQLNDLAKGAQTMLGFNMAAEKVMPMLKAIGDISMGDAGKFQSLTLAFSQMQSVGKLMGQDLLQMINAGFSPLAVIADKTGKSIGQLKEEMSEGAISSELVTQAFIDATSEGGKFFGMLSGQGDTVKGAIAQLSGAVTDMFNSLGEQSEGIIKGTIDSLKWLAENYATIGKLLAGIIATYGTYKAIMITVVALERLQVQLALAKMAGLTKEAALLDILKAKQIALNKAVSSNPYVILAMAIVGASYAIYKLATAEDAAEKAQRKHNDAMQEGKKRLDDYKQSVEDYLSVLRDDTATQLQRTEAYEKLLQLLPELQGMSMQEVSAMGGDKLDRLKNVEADKRHYADLKKQAEEAQRAVESTQASIQNALNNSQSNAQSAGAGVLMLSGMLEEQQESLRLIQEEVKAHEELVKRAEWESKTHEEKVASLEAQLRRAEQLKASYADQLPPQVRQLALHGKIADALQVSRDKYSGIYSILQSNVSMTAQWLNVSEGLQSRLAGLRGSTPKSYTTALKDAKQAYDEAKKAMEASKKGSEVDYKKAVEEYKSAKEAYEALGGETDRATNYKQRASERAARLAEERKRLQQLDEMRRDYARKQHRQAIDSAIALQQAHLNTLEDGLDKELQLARLHTAQLKEENRRRAEDWVATLQQQREEEWKLQNPNKAKQGYSYTGVATVDDLTAQQRAQLAEYDRIALEAGTKAEADALAKRLQQYASYSQERKRIAEEYAKHEAELYIVDREGKKSLRAGATQENIDELKRQSEEALRELDETWAEREETYQAWMTDLATMSLAQLEEELVRVQALLESAKGKGVDGKSVAILKTQVAQLTKRLREAERQAHSTKQSFSDWSRLIETLRNTKAELDGIAESIRPLSETIADSIQGVASLVTPVISIIGSIGKFAELTQAGIATTATATQKAISLAEKGTVVLAIISAALQVITKIISLFNNDKRQEERIKALDEQIARLQWRVSHMGWEELEESAGRPLDTINDKLAEAEARAMGAALAVGGVESAMQVLADTSTGVTEAGHSLADAYMRADYMAGKLLGTARYTRVREELDLMGEQIALIAKKREAEASKSKGKDDSKIAEYDQQMQEMAEKMAQRVDDIFNDLLGGDAIQLADKLGNALFDAFSRGEDAAKAFHDTVDDIIQSMVKKLLIQQFLEEPLKKAINKLKEEASKDGEFSLEEFMGLIPMLYGELNKVGEAAKNMPNILDSILKGLGIDPNDGISGQRKGIATASQESVDELNGRATAIQSHTANIASGTALLTNLAQSTLEQVVEIARLVKEGNASRQRIETSTATIANKVRDFETYGIKVKR